MTVAVRVGDYFWDVAGGPGSISRTGSTMTISNTDSAGQDLTAILEGLLEGDVIHVDEKDDPNGWWVYTVTAAPTPGGGAPPVAAAHLQVDNYSGGFLRVRPGQDDPTTVDFRLATTPGPGGAVYPNVAAIPNAAAVWVDFNGTLGKLKRANGADVLGSTLKDWITRGAVLNAEKDTSDPTHPGMKISTEVLPPPPADTTAVPITAGGHGTLANPTDGDEMRVTFMLMNGPPPPPVTGPVRPTPDEISARLGLPAGNPLIEEFTIAALTAQDTDCNTEPYAYPLREAAFRRTANLWASKAHTLGVMDTGLEGISYVPRYDPIIDALEGPYRKIPVS